MVPPSSWNSLAARAILVVDDDPAVRLVSGEMLARLGCTVQVAGSGAEGLDALARQQFDAVLIDLAMPDMSGMQLYAAIRASQPALPVIIMTGLTTSTADPLVADGTPTWLLGKPFSVNELGVAITRALSA